MNMSQRARESSTVLEIAQSSACTGSRFRDLHLEFGFGSNRVARLLLNWLRCAVSQVNKVALLLPNSSTCNSGDDAPPPLGIITYRIDPGT